MSYLIRSIRPCSTAIFLSSRPIFHPIRSFHAAVGTKRFTKDHEYVLVTGPGKAQVGITKYAQQALGEVVYIDFPEVGARFAKGAAFGSVESVKAASSIYMPADAKVTETNATLMKDFSLVNKSPEGDGWIIKVDLEKPDQLKDLLTQDKYDELCAAASH